MADEHGSHAAPYFAVFVALCVLTGLSVVSDVLPIRHWNYLGLIVIVLAIAAFKALFVLTYFMHLKFEGRWKYLLLSPTIMLAFGIPLALFPDIGIHYYTPIVPQMKAHLHDDAPTHSVNPQANEPDAPPESNHH